MKLVVNLTREGDLYPHIATVADQVIVKDDLILVIQGDGSIEFDRAEYPKIKIFHQGSFDEGKVVDPARPANHPFADLYTPSQEQISLTDASSNAEGKRL